MTLGKKMSVWFSNKTRAKVLKYESYPLWLPTVQLPIAALVLAAGLGLTPGARGQGLIALIGTLWLGRLGWCFYRIIQTRLFKARLRPTP